MENVHIHASKTKEQLWFNDDLRSLALGKVYTPVQLFNIMKLYSQTRLNAYLF